MLIQQIPIIPLDGLNSKTKVQIKSLFELISKENSENSWLEVDTWVAEQFGLNKRDLQVINDTLKYNLPFAENKKMAQAKPDENQVYDFCEELGSELSPWTKRFKTEVQIFSVNDIANDAPWVILGIQTSDANQANFQWAEILSAANEIGTTEVFIPNESGKGLWIARLRQGRYWSRSQARLLARRIVWEHLETVFGPRKAA